jgi:hypothetical protein
MAIHGRSLLAVMERMSGRIDEATHCTVALERVSKNMRNSDRWLAWAATFSATVAAGDRWVTPPFPPESSADPVTSMASLIVEAELTMTGRGSEALARFERSGPAHLGPIGELGSVIYALSLVTSGRGTEALPWIDLAAGAAVALEAEPVGIAAAALRAEVTGDLTGLPSAPKEAGSVSDVLLLRAYAAGGDSVAGAALENAVARLAMPGLALES